jgi:hypothetical protein
MPRFKKHLYASQACKKSFPGGILITVTMTIADEQGYCMEILDDNKSISEIVAKVNHEE